jgi:hypothetical protein
MDEHVIVFIGGVLWGYIIGLLAMACIIDDE